MAEVPKALDNESNDKSIEIFVFSNGQQYSPPRKYHLCAEDLHLWRSTLNFLARTQYGCLHTNVELYTLGGKKITSPMELGNGASYVAVEPPDKFLIAGYDKYLIRASRSYEKRHSKLKDNVSEPESSARSVASNRGEESLLQTIVSSMVNHNTSVIVTPELETPLEEKPEIQISSTKTTEKKKTSVQRPSIIRKNISNAAPVSFVKPTSKRDIKTVNGKIIRPDGDRNSASTSYTLTKMPVKNKVNKIIIRSKDTVLPEPPVQEEPNEIKTSSVIQIKDVKEINVSSNSVDVKNVIEDKELVIVTNLNNHSINMPLVDEIPIYIKHDPIKLNTETIFDEKSHSLINKRDACLDIHADTIEDMTNKNNYKNVISSQLPVMKALFSTANDTEKTLDTLNEKSILEGNINTNNELKQSDFVKISESSEHRHSVMVMTDDVSNNKHKYIQNSTCVPAEQFNITNEIKLHATENTEPIKTNDINAIVQSGVTDMRLDDEYVAILHKGDVINLKLNIEIKNHDGSYDRHTDNAVNIHSTANILNSEKGSQINMTNSVSMQNTSLVALITKEINNLDNKRTNHQVIVVKCNNCKYCRDLQMSDIKPNKSYLVLLPLDQFEMSTKRCNCERPQLQNQVPSNVNPSTACNSCMSQHTLPELIHENCRKETPSLNIANTKTEANSTIIETKASATTVNKDGMAHCGAPDPVRESSKVHNDVNNRTEFVTVSHELLTAVASKAVIDKSTQTEWCDVLLEARLLDDGHYAFHWPTLEMVKLYKLG